jgi:hypothetical protein
LHQDSKTCSTVSARGVFRKECDGSIPPVFFGSGQLAHDAFDPERSPVARYNRTDIA